MILMNTFNCILCLEDVKNANKQILCTKCDKSCCTTCFQTYMLHCRNDPLCPNPDCDYIHGVCSLRGILSQTFWNNEYKASRKIVLYHHEQMYKDATMVEIARYKDEKAVQKCSGEYRSTKNLIVSKQEKFLMMIRNFCTTHLLQHIGNGWETCALEIARTCWKRGLQRDVIFYNTFSGRMNATLMRSNTTWLKHQKVFNDEIHQIEKLKTILENHRVHWETLRIRLSLRKNEDDRTPKPRYRVPCHVNECAGICTESSSCPICLSKTCSECHQKLDDKHECNKDDLETVKEILNNSKPCPTCNEAISKVHGCDQMLCTSCHTAFSWQTGKIDKGRVHNPHYYELQRRGVRRELGDAICGGLPDWWDLETRIYLPWRNVMKKHHKLVAHIRGAVFPLIVNLDHSFNTNLESRVRYYVQEINKSQFENILFKQEKQRTMSIELRDLLQTFVTVSEDVFQKINQKQAWSIGKDKLLKNLADHVEESELKGIFEYMIEQYHAIVRKYASKLSLNAFLRYNRCQHSSMDKQKVENLYVSLDADLESGERVLRALDG